MFEVVIKSVMNFSINHSQPCLSCAGTLEFLCERKNTYVSLIKWFQFSSYHAFVPHPSLSFPPHRSSQPHQFLTFLAPHIIYHMTFRSPTPTPQRRPDTYPPLRSRAMRSSTHGSTDPESSGRLLLTEVGPRGVKGECDARCP